jgi:hypothetical protein
MVRRLVKNALEGICKENDRGTNKIFSRNFSGESEKNCEKYRSE